MVQRTGKIFVAALVLCCVVFSFTGCGEAQKEYNMAVELMESGKYKDSIGHLQNAIKENNEKAEYYIAYGIALNGTGNYEEAVKEFNKAYQDTDNKISRQNNKRLYLGQAVSYYGMYNNEKALEACDKALGYGNEVDTDIKIKSIKAQVNILMGNTEEALGIYNDIIKEDDSQAGIYVARGRLYEETGESSKAVSDYSAAIKQDKKCYDAYFAMYDIYTRLGDSQKADETLNKLAGIEAKTADEVMQLGRMYYYKGDYKNALSNLEKAVKDGCNQALYYTGMVYMAQGSYKEAENKFNEYIKTGSMELVPEAYNQMAGCYIELEDFKAASGCIDKGMASGINGASLVLGKNRVILYERMGQYKKAKKAASLYLKSFPGDKDMKKELAFIKTRIKTLQLAKNSQKGQ